MIFQDRKKDADEFLRIVTGLHLLRFHPKEPSSIGAVFGFIMDMVNNLDELEWLVKAAQYAWNDWPGPRDLRALFCTKFHPADGIYVSFAQPPGGYSTKEQISQLRSMPYEEYLNTDHWRCVRNEKLRESGFCCQLCNSSDNPEVHHRTYERRGCEALVDLIVLCHDCHQLFHERQTAASVAGI